MNTLDDNALKESVIEINEYASVYYDYKTEFENMNEFKWSDYQSRLLLILNSLDTTTFNPYILMVLKEKEEAETRFLNLEKFLLYRFIYDGTTKNYNQSCEKLLQVSDVKKYLDEYMADSPALNDSYKVRFRKLNNNQAKLILFLIEMLYRDGAEDKYSDALKIEKFSLEHLIPQKWQASWYVVDSYDENNIAVDRNKPEEFTLNRNRAVKSLGNMALLTTKLDTSISNSSMDIKMDGK